MCSRRQGKQGYVLRFFGGGCSETGYFIQCMALESWVW